VTGTLAPMPVTVDWIRFDAVLFDLDGVITPTAEIHERAWAALFEPWGFSSADYLTYVDGKPRYDGVRSFLRSRHVELPWGDPSDPAGTGTICAMGNRKNDLFNEVLDRDGVAPYIGTMAVLDLLDAHRIPQAIVSSSKNARRVLAAAGLTERFPVVVDGLTAATEGLDGKPAPAMFLHAATLVGATPDRSAVVEDASSGVAAGAAGGFALVLGVDRGGNATALLAAGAHLVVDDLGDTLGTVQPVADRADTGTTPRHERR
jgi:beta-phosphoglucomutase family hydrolase